MQKTNELRFFHVLSGQNAPQSHGVRLRGLKHVSTALSKNDLARTIQRIDGSLAEGGSLVACHWRHPVAEYPQTGDSVHAALRRTGRWQAIVRHEEPDFVLEVFRRPPALSVAQQEGLV